MRSLPRLRFVALALLAVACDETIAPTLITGADAGAPLPPDGGTLCAGAPNDNIAVVNDGCGFFVSPNGSDAAPGTKAAPVATLAKALELAHVSFKHVFVCGGTDVVYREAATLALVSSDTGRGIFGGLSCDSWTFDETQRPTVVVPGSGQAVLRVDGTKEARIENLHIVSSDAVDPGASSIAIFVTAGAHLRVRHVNVEAGRGGDGARGVDAPEQVAPATSGLAAAGLAGGAATACACPDEMTNGGAGGDGGADAGAGASGAPALADSGAGGAAGLPCDAGGGGALGRMGDDGDGGAHSFRHGELSESAWTPRQGLPGAAGRAGQGGGGGAGALDGGGGGGGCGGCGGAAGRPAQTGGSSIAIAVFQADLDVIESNLFVKRGGDGGNGGVGQPGQSGGSGGVPGAGGCAGGAGGNGGAGGGGGGGAGGHSVAVLYKGPIPTVDGPSSAAARLGVPGKGGLRGGATANTDRAPAGVAAALWISD